MIGGTMSDEATNGVSGSGDKTARRSPPATVGGRPVFLILAGPNGSGKSTMARRLVLETWGVQRFLNADTIARGLAAYGPELAAVSAGRVMLTEADDLIAAGDSLAVETTLSGRVWANRLRGAVAGAGHWRHLAFVYTGRADENVARVASRVSGGGHDIPEHDIRRRYERALGNLFRIYIPLVDSWEVYDNTASPTRLVARGGPAGPPEVADPVEWQRLEDRYA